MTSGELITDVLVNHLNQGGRDALEAKNRRKAEFHLQGLANKAWGKAPYHFKRTSSNISLPADGLGTFDFPANFNGMGSRGGLFISGERFEIIYKPADVMERKRQLDAGTTSRPEFYGYRDQSARGIKKGVVHRINSVALTLVLTNYDRTPPMIVDRPIAPTLAEGAAGAYTGTRTYRVTFTTAEGETEGSPASDPITVTAKKITVIIPTSENPKVTGRKLYATEDGGVLEKLAATVTDNVTTEVTDETLDVALGADVPTSATATTGLELFPSGYHESVFCDGLKARLRGNQGDLREGQADREFEEGIRDMWVNTKEDRNRVPRSARYGATAYRR